MNDDERGRLLARVAREHEENPHPGTEGERLRLHLAIHVVVETQLAEGKPTEVQRTLARLTAGGMERHQAIHAIGHVASEEVVACLSTGRRYDEERYVQRLQALSAVDVC
jgi:hypothetical protein